MMRHELDSDSDWLQVIAKCLCYLCLEQTDLRSSSLLERARFLQGFGLSRKDSAEVLGTTDKSLAELDRQSRKKGKKSGSKKKAR
jgi:hypothetical protein